jgi:hypothetical protein
VPVITYPVDEATTDIRDLQRMPTDGLIEIGVDDSAAVSFCVCSVNHYTNHRLED